MPEPHPFEPRDAEVVDDIVIGAGQGGLPLALKLAGRGRRVRLFERDRVGGSCVNYGCTPSKTLIASAQAAARARAAARLGVHADVRVDGEAVLRRVREVRDEKRRGAERSLRDAGVEVVPAEASLDRDGRVRGGGRTMRAERVILDTGSRPRTPPIDGLDEVPTLTDRTVWDLERPPEHLLVLGAGLVGLELGQAFARLGSRVTMLQRGDRVASREAPDVARVLEEALRRDGVDLRTGAELAAVAPHGEGLRATLTGGGTIDVDALLVATGRRPNTDALGADAAGIELDEHGHVVVDERLATTRAGVWAIGEVAGRPPFTHVSWEDHRRLLSAWDGDGREAGDATLGYALFTDPQVARVGLAHEDAEARGLRPRRARVDVSDTARGTEWGHDLGFFEIVADGDGRLIGATFVAPDAAEVAHLLQALVQDGASWRALDRLVAVHPTFAENLPGLARRLAP